MNYLNISFEMTFSKAGTAQLAGVGSRVIPNKRDGTMYIDAVEAAIRGENIHFPITELIALENTHNYCGGRVLPKGYTEVPHRTTYYL